jgi:hypothetical protein
MARFTIPSIPVAVSTRKALTRFGAVSDIPGFDAGSACVLKETVDGEVSVWCAVGFGGYRRACAAVASQTDWKAFIDADHLVARAVAWKLKLDGWFLRMHPVYAEVNRSAGAGREKDAAQTTSAAKALIGRRSGDVIFAGELQFLKIIGHPVGTSSDPDMVGR